MPDRRSSILTLNGGSSSIKFALFTADRRELSGVIERIGSPQSKLSAKDSAGQPIADEPLAAADHQAAADHLLGWLGDRTFDAVGHRVVYGGLQLLDHQLITPQVIAELHRSEPLDLAHLPLEIALIETFAAKLPATPQFACFDTAFHRDLPRVAQLLPIPRRHIDAGIRRFGFHGLSYTYLLDALRRLAPGAAEGRVIFAHLGAGASLAAVHHGKPIDTTMAFTPTAGLMMATRPGDLDPGLLVYLARTENLSPDALDHLINHDCGLAGVSGGVSDMRDLLSRRATDPRAADAIDLFCHTLNKSIAALTASLGGLDTLVFSGGVGEHAPPIRAQTCAALAHLGLTLHDNANSRHAPIISADASSVIVRVIPTDEEAVIARIVRGLLQTLPTA